MTVACCLLTHMMVVMVTTVCTLLGTHMVVFGGLKKYPEQPVGPRTAAQCQHRLIEVLLGLQGQQQLKGQENIKHMTFHCLLFRKNGM